MPLFRHFFPERVPDPLWLRQGEGAYGGDYRGGWLLALLRLLGLRPNFDCSTFMSCCRTAAAQGDSEKGAALLQHLATDLDFRETLAASKRRREFLAELAQVPFAPVRRFAPPGATAGSGLAALAEVTQSSRYVGSGGGRQVVLDGLLLFTQFPVLEHGIYLPIELREGLGMHFSTVPLVLQHLNQLCGLGARDFATLDLALPSWTGGAINVLDEVRPHPSASLNSPALTRYRSTRFSITAPGMESTRRRSWRRSRISPAFSWRLGALAPRRGW